MNILFVCTGNTCRSPMAEGLYARKYKKRGDGVSSAGIYVSNDMPPSVNAVTVMNEIGIDISHHKSRPITENDLRKSDMIIAMTDSHAKILELLGADMSKVKVLGVSDPFGGYVDDYRKCRNEIEEKLNEIFSR